MLSSSAFKAYDVRGVVPDELDAEGAYRLGRAYVAAFEPSTIAVGHDMRLTSPELAQAVAEGAADQGADVVQLGEIGTEMLYFAVGEYGYEGGIQVTASHNPSRYNGMKIVRRGALPVGGDTGLEQIKALAAGEPAASDRRGTITQRDVYAEFHDRVMQFVDADALRPLKVVLDGGCRSRRSPSTSTRTAASPAASPTRSWRRTAASSSTAFASTEPTSASPGTATPTAVSSSTTAASSCPAT